MEKSTIRKFCEEVIEAAEELQGRTAGYNIILREALAEKWLYENTYIVSPKDALNLILPYPMYVHVMILVREENITVCWKGNSFVSIPIESIGAREFFKFILEQRERLYQWTD